MGRVFAVLRVARHVISGGVPGTLRILMEPRLLGWARIGGRGVERIGENH